MDDPVLQKAINEWDRASNDFEAHFAYLGRHKYVLDELSKT